MIELHWLVLWLLASCCTGFGYCLCGALRAEADAQWPVDNDGNVRVEW